MEVDRRLRQNALGEKHMDECYTIATKIVPKLGSKKKVKKKAFIHWEIYSIWHCPPADEMILLMTNKGPW